MNGNKNNKKIFETESSEGIYPEIMRCKNCMKSHFPNKRFCKWSASRHKEELGKTLEEETKKSVKKHVEDLSKHYSKLIKPTRLRGGANVDGAQSSLFVKAISNAKKHGINLVPGILN